MHVDALKIILLLVAYEPLVYTLMFQKPKVFLT